jgi:hypothetical protein
VFRALLAATALAASLVFVPTSAAAFPTINYTIDGIVGANGWYRGSNLGNFVVLHWSVSSDTIETNCLPAITVPGPELGKTFSCYAKNAANERTDATTKSIKVDADPPTGVALHISRAPDHNGWYNHPVLVTWSGNDATSGIASCSSVNFAGPEGVNVSVVGGCTDNAGNAVSTGVSINYDATAPVLSHLSVGSTSTDNVVRWSSSEPTAKVVVRRAPRGDTRDRIVFKGTSSSFVDKHVDAGLEYVYTLRALDQAGNQSAGETVVGLPKVLTLRDMPYIPRAAPNPILRWERVGGARYYNVQLFRGAKRVLAAWPATHQFGVPKAWKWEGRKYRLSPGRYRWYVWAGFGSRSFARYRTVGSAAFIVAPRSNR